VAGDLAELHVERVRSEGRLRADLWYRGQVLGLVVGFVREWVWEWGSSSPREEGKRMMFEEFRSDVAFVLRGILKRPLMAVWSVVALGVGIGLVTTTFSILWGSLLRGLPVEASERLVHFERRAVEGDAEYPVSHHDYLDWKERQSTFDGMGAYVEAVLTLAPEGGAPVRLDGLYADRSTFEVLRVQPRVGRLFSDEELAPGGPAVVLLSDRAWTTHFGADPGLVGSAIEVNGTPTTVVGIMPPGFRFPFSEDGWLPLRLDRGAVERGQGRLDVIGRLVDGVSFESAAAEMESIGRALEAEFPGANANIRPAPMSFNREFIGDEFPRIAWGLLAGSLLVLVVACANVASLTLVRAAARTREVALRAALGAGRARIFRQLLTESFVLAALGALLGTGLAMQGVRWFGNAAFRAGTLRLPHGSVAPYWWDFQLDAGPLLFTVGAAFLVTALVGTAPAVLAARREVNEVLKAGGRGSVGGARGWSLPLVAIETALSGAVLVAAAVMVGSMLRVTAVDGGVHTEGLVAGRIGLPQGDGNAYPTHADRAVFWQRLSEELQRTPGVRAATVTTGVPVLRATATTVRDESAGATEDLPRVRVAAVDPGFFQVFGLETTTGRVIGSEDRAGTEPVIVINESLARRHFGEQPALGRRLRLGGTDSTDPWLTVVGVVPDFWMNGELTEDTEGAYTALAQGATSDPVARHGRLGLLYSWVVVSVDGGVRAGHEGISAALARLDPALPVYSVQTMEEIVDTRLRRYRLFGTFYLVFGATALFLAVLGTYAVTAYSVRSREPELGVRMALGAGAGRIRSMVLRQSFTAVGAGLVVAFALALWVTAGLGRIAYEVEARSPVAFGLGLGVLALAALIACLVPAFRATRIEPTVALRPD